MISLNQEDIINTLRSVGIKANDHLFIHSSLFALGNIQNTKIQDLPLALLECFKTAIGDDGSIFMPAFNYQFPSTRYADLRTQKTELGSWPEWFRQQSGVVRSGHPMFSICGLGTDAETICQPEHKEQYSFGENSTFQRLIETDCVLVLQGVGLKVATVIVQIEAMLGLNYRFNKPFFGELTLPNGSTIQDNFYHFCFPINNAYRESYTSLEKALLSTGTMQQAQLGRSFIYTVRMKALYTFIKSFIEQDPFALLNSKPKQLYKFENGQEIAYEISNHPHHTL
ncbi:AAC(3) family N-acetyltransferase [Pseudoalteromonas mariniglutinosa]|uniref:AAC(3) family N-acetyltransferase n=1 Tax=Pseudoalteromonas mariniglutinosa TaxID=206042 RepID=UPI00384DAAFB